MLIDDIVILAKGRKKVEQLNILHDHYLDM